MNLYVWPQYRTDFTDGLAFCFAESLDDAQQFLVLKEGIFDEDFHTSEDLEEIIRDFGPVSVFPVSEIEEGFCYESAGGA